MLKEGYGLHPAKQETLDIQFLPTDIFCSRQTFTF